MRFILLPSPVVRGAVTVTLLLSSACNSSSDESDSGIVFDVGQCDPGFAYCDTLACVDLQTDRDNCGSCGTECGNGWICLGGECVDLRASDAVTVGDPGWFADLVIDQNDRPHVAYYENASTSLQYASASGDRWAVTELDSAGNVGWSPSIALQATGEPAVAYYDFDRASLKYIEMRGGTWRPPEEVDVPMTGSWTGVSPELNFDGGAALISFHDDAPEALRLAERATSDWSFTTLDDEGDGSMSGGYFWSELFVIEGRQEIVYVAPGVPAIRHRQRGDDQWASWQDVYQPPRGTQFSDFEASLGADGRLYVAAITWPGAGTTTTLLFGRYDGSEWEVEEVRQGLLDHPTLAADRQGTVHLAYDDDEQGLVYRRRLQGSWEDEVVLDATPNAGNFARLVLDSSGFPHIISYNGDRGMTGALRYSGPRR